MRRSQTRKTTAFTLIELLVVIAIIAILAGMILPPMLGTNNSVTTEVVIDATIYQDTLTNFTKIKGGWAEFHRTSHLQGRRAAGGNILFLDGHVAWRAFKQMTNRTPDFTVGGPPVFCF